MPRAPSGIKSSSNVAITMTGGPRAILGISVVWEILILGLGLGHARGGKVTTTVHVFWSQTNLALNLGLILACCVTLGQSLDLSE